jgi:hypothetical protein
MKKTRPPDKKLTSRAKPRGEPRSTPAGRRKGTALGYAQDAGHPGGLQDLGAKTDTEAEHEGWERHG